MNLRERASLVDTVGSALSRGEHTLTILPQLIRKLLVEEAWQEFETKMGKHVSYTQFDEFVITPPLAGLGASVDLIEKIVRDDPETLLLFRKALKRPVGRPEKTVDIINGLERPTGTSQAYALQRLEQERPDLLERVKCGELSPHKAMREAGFRKPRIAVNLDDPESAAKTLLTHSSPEFIEELKRLLEKGVL